MDSRVENIKGVLEPCEAAIIKSDVNRFYLTGFSSSAGILFITKKKSYLLIDFRYFEKAKSVVKNFNVILLTDTFKQINALCDENNIKTLYTECDRISVSEQSAFSKNIAGVFVSNDNKIGKALENVRGVKSPYEILSIKKAQEITDKTFSYILERIDVGRTEKEIALEMEFYLRKSGSDGVAFDFIAISGKNTSLPHGVPTDKKIEKGDFVTMDFGANVNGYKSDMTRTVAVGFVTDEQKSVYETVLKAQEAAFSHIKPGAVCKDIDFASRSLIDNAGYKGCFGHGLGHSVGIEIHESPSFNTRDNTILKSGNVITVEPGIYLENKFGVRIEDMIIVNDTSFENITKSSKELIIL